MSTKEIVRQVAVAEHRLIEPVLAWQDGKLVRALTPLCKLADETPLMVLSGATLTAGLVLRRPGTTRLGVRMFAAHLVANAAKTVLKGSVDRLRPNAVDHEPEIKPGSGTDNKAANAFPSGHTAGAVAVAQAVAHEFPRVAAPARAVAVVASATQVPRGAHYLTDMLSGAAVGWASERIAGYVLARLEPIILTRTTRKPSATSV
ncbi:PAP2 superfamily protein [Sphingomonas palmae]|uniref:PAP2 superfamily protein n=1 Tax=Sphingomonas palmae TaxID=1855283 RepID=A0A1H7HRL4_9SPHN|nr:phosphatase PAP2 family protein [Sphingomonas palmae]SEK51660.1 PAP2 superfamily protein [Sphingomonas palmae]